MRHSLNRACSQAKTTRAGAVLVVAVLLAMLTVPVLPAAAAIKIASVGGSATAPDGSALNQAGAHPDLTIKIGLEAQVIEPNGFPKTIPVEAAKDIKVDLPPGLVGAPGIFPQCSEGELVAGNQELTPECPAPAQVGTIDPAGVYGPMGIQPLYNMTPPAGHPAMFAANILGNVIRITPVLRAGGGYHVGADSIEVSQGLNLTGVTVKLWGVPADPSHNTERWAGVTNAGTPDVALMSNPTSCSGEPVTTTVQADSWQTPGVFDTASFDTDFSGEPLVITGCEKLPFAPRIVAQPTTLKRGVPAGFELKLEIPQSEAPTGLATAHLKRAELLLPEGMAVNPSFADGLGACSPEQIGLGTDAPPTCPANSRIGSVVIHTPLIEDVFSGGMYLAKQGDNPFGSLVALYIIAQGPGVMVKLPGSVQLDPASGRLKVVFDNDPQLPFSSLVARLNAGPRAPLTMPSTCGEAVTTAILTPWSGTPPVTATSAFQVSSDGNGGACAPLGFTPTLRAGTTNAVAGSFSPFALDFARSDEESTFGQISSLTLPKGLLGTLKGVPYCPEAALAGISTAEGSGAAQVAAPACPAASQIGTVSVAAGAGSNPFYVNTGKAYLTGPYKGAPLGLAIVTPALAGPFDLGNVLVRATLRIDPHTAQITVTSDPFPKILYGVPLNIRDVRVSVDRSDFTINPTSCSPQSVDATMLSNAGQSASISDRFQVGECARLAFKPAFSASTSAKTSRATGARLNVKLAFPGATGTAGTGQANVARVKVDLPRQLPSRLTTLQKACVAAVFEANPANCPSESIVGHAKAITPILNVPLEGPAYFVSHGGEAFPSLILVLQGQGIVIDLVGQTDIENGITSSTFATVPDAPISSFELNLPTGKYSALTANGDLCAGKLVMPTAMTGQNGATLTQATPVTVEGCPSGLAIASHSIKNRTLYLSIRVPAAGELKASGKGLRTVSKPAKGRETLTLKLTQKQSGKLATKVKLAFTPRKGAKLAKSLVVKFGK
jgi:hypothetical protein